MAPVEATRRRLCYWLLTAFLERGVDPLRDAERHAWQPTHRSRPLSPEECREFLRPSVNVTFLPQPRRG